MALTIYNYPNLYREPEAGAPYELYGDQEMYLKWRGPLREAARVQVLNILAPVYGQALTDAGYNLDDALNHSKMWTLAFGSGSQHRIYGHNLLDIAEIFSASLNLNAIHEHVDFQMANKMAQFVQKAHQVAAAGFGSLANVDDLVIGENVEPVQTVAPVSKTGWVVPLGLVVAAISLLG